LKRPELFEKAEWYERQGKAEDREIMVEILGLPWSYTKEGKFYTWNGAYSLMDIKRRSEKIYKKNCAKIAGLVDIYLKQKAIEIEEDIVETSVSCGLWCAK